MAPTTYSSRRSLSFIFNPRSRQTSARKIHFPLCKTSRPSSKNFRIPHASPPFLVSGGDRKNRGRPVASCRVICADDVQNGKNNAGGRTVRGSSTGKSQSLRWQPRDDAPFTKIAMKAGREVAVFQKSSPWGGKGENGPQSEQVLQVLRQEVRQEAPPQLREVFIKKYVVIENVLSRTTSRTAYRYKS